MDNSAEDASLEKRHMDNPIENASFRFAVRIVKFSKWLRKEHNEYELASQILRSGTSIGANVAEAQYAQSKKDFVSKMHIALKESYETKYWLRLLVASDIVPSENLKPLMSDVDELLKMLTSIVKKAKV